MENENLKKMKKRHKLRVASYKIDRYVQRQKNWEKMTFRNEEVDRKRKKQKEKDRKTRAKLSSLKS